MKKENLLEKFKYLSENENNLRYKLNQLSANLESHKAEVDDFINDIKRLTDKRAKK